MHNNTVQLQLTAWKDMITAFYCQNVPADGDFATYMYKQLHYMLYYILHLTSHYILHPYYYMHNNYIDKHLEMPKLIKEVQQINQLNLPKKDFSHAACGYKKIFTSTQVYINKLIYYSYKIVYFIKIDQLSQICDLKSWSIWPP